jgi:hypothetical protein
MSMHLGIFSCPLYEHCFDNIVSGVNKRLHKSQNAVNKAFLVLQYRHILVVTA